VSSGKVCLYLSLLSIAASAEWSPEVVENIREGRALQVQGRFQEAKVRFESALREAEKVPKEADQLAVALSNLASVQIDLGRMDEAARLCERAISILIKVAGEADSRVQRSAPNWPLCTWNQVRTPRPKSCSDRQSLANPGLHRRPVRRARMLSTCLRASMPAGTN
jgi:tetratricopeptide (TPR) repeat protein